MHDSDVEVEVEDELESIREVSNWSEELVICPETLGTTFSTNIRIFKKKIRFKN